MEELLRSIDWNTLQTWKGDPKQLPALLSSLLSLSERDRDSAHTQLHEMLLKDSVVASAAKEVVRVLLSLVQDDATPEREELLLLLVSLAIGDEWRCLRFGADGVGTDVYPAIRALTPVCLRWLSVPSAPLRATAAYFLAFFPDAALPAVLKEKIADEADEVAKASMILCLGMQLGPDRWMKDPIDEWPFSLWKDKSQSFLIRFACAAGLLFQLHRHFRNLPKRMYLLLEGIEEMDLWAPFLGWGKDNVSRLASALLSSVHKRYASAEFATEDDEIYQEPTPTPEAPNLDEDPSLVSNPYVFEKASEAAPVVTLEGFDKIPWSELDDAYGPATWVPRQIQALASPEEKDREWGLGALFAGINHQGSIYSASPYAVPFLIALLKHPKVEDKDGILRLLAGLAMHDPAWCLVKGAEQLSLRSTCYEAVCEGASVFASLLSHESAKVRLAASYLLAFLQEPAPLVIGKVRDALLEEQDPRARGSHLLCLGLLGRYLRSLEDKALFLRFFSSHDRLIKLCAALALLYLEGAKAPLEAMQHIEQERAGTFYVQGFLWSDNNLSGFASQLYRASRSNEALFEDLSSDAASVRHDASADLLARLFPKDYARQVSLWLPEELSPEQRRLLTYKAQNEAEQLWSLSSLGLPHNQVFLGRFLGLVPEGALDKRLPWKGQSLPCWKLLWMALHDEMTQAEWISLLNTQKTPEDIEDLLLDLFEDSYALWFLRDDGYNPEHFDAEITLATRYLQVCAATAALLQARAVPFVKARLASYSPDKYRGRFECLVALLILAQHNALSEEYDALVRLDNAPVAHYPVVLREILQAMPLERRAKKILPLPLFGYLQTQNQRGTLWVLEPARAWDFIDLCPTKEATEKLLSAMYEWDAYEENPFQDPKKRGKPGSPQVGYNRNSYGADLPKRPPFPWEKLALCLSSFGELLSKTLQESLQTGLFQNKEFRQKLTEAAQHPTINARQ